jgi:hypothetical protein
MTTTTEVSQADNVPSSSDPRNFICNVVPSKEIEGAIDAIRIRNPGRDLYGIQTSRRNRCTIDFERTS